MNSSTFFKQVQSDTQNNIQNKKDFSPFAKRLKRLRKITEKTQVDLSHILNLSDSTYGTYERSEYLPDAKIIRDLAEYFNISSDYLLGIIDQPIKLNNNNINNFSSKITQDLLQISKDNILKETFEQLVHQKEFMSFINYIYLYIIFKLNNNAFIPLELDNRFDVFEIYKINLHKQLDMILDKLIKQNKKNKEDYKND